MTLDEHERFIIEQIQLLQHAYQKAAQPWIQRLANVRALRSSQTIVVDSDFLRKYEAKP